MGFFSRFRAQNAVAPPADLSARVQALERTVEKLELERPAFVAELEAMAERCHDILDQAESKRARVAAAESRAKKREEREPEPEELTDRESIKAAVRARLARNGLH